MLNPPAPLTLARLIELHACEPALALFRSTFGDSVDTANPPKGYEALDFDWEWAAIKLWDQPARTERDKITTPATWAERDKTIAAAWADYYKTIAPATWAERDKAVAAAAWVDYDGTVAAARADYDKINAAARADRNKINAPTFVAGYVATFYRQQQDN